MDAEKKLVEDVRAVLLDIEHIVSDVKGKTAKEFAEAQETLTDKLDMAKAMLLDSEQDLLNKEQVAIEMTDSFIRENAWKLLIVVAVISFFIGYTMQ